MSLSTLFEYCVIIMKNFLELNFFNVTYNKTNIQVPVHLHNLCNLSFSFHLNNMHGLIKYMSIMSGYKNNFTVLIS